MMGIGALMGATVFVEGLGEGAEDSNWWNGEWESRSSDLTGCLIGVILEVPGWVAVSPLELEPLGVFSPPKPIARISANTFNSFPLLAVSALLLFAVLFAIAGCLGLRPACLPGLVFGSFPPLALPFPPLVVGSASGFSSALGMLSLLGRNQRIVEGMWMVGVAELKTAGV